MDQFLRTSGHLCVCFSVPVCFKYTHTRTKMTVLNMVIIAGGREVTKLLDCLCVGASNSIDSQDGGTTFNVIPMAVGVIF